MILPIEKKFEKIVTFLNRPTYNTKKNMKNIIKINGFYIKSEGTTSYDTKDIVWKLVGDFYFDNQKELNEFIFNLKIAFVNYCGKVIIDTY